MPRATRSRKAKAPPPKEVVEEEEDNIAVAQQQEAEETTDVMDVDEEDRHDEEEQSDEGGQEEDDRAEEEEEEGEGVLENDEPITWKAGKPIPLGTLLKRLKALSEELQATGQGEISRESLVPKAKELANSQLLTHKEHGVVAYTLLCIVEMFKLLAPDAPYKQSQLTEIFDRIVAVVIPAIGKPSHPYNAQHQAIIHSLATVKSIALIADLHSEKLVVSFFVGCFDVMADNVPGGERELLSKNVEFNFTALLNIITEEMDPLPSSVVDVILAQFLRADPRASPSKGKDGKEEGPMAIKEVSPAYNMARSVCNSCDEILRRHIGHYFNSVLIDANETKEAIKPSKSRSKKRARDDSEDEDDSEILGAPSETDLLEAEKAHRMLRELWRACPNLIQNVIPQIEAEVGAENTPLRTMGVAAVGDMIAGIGAAGPPVPASLDPAAWPSQSLDGFVPPPQNNILLVAAAPQAFSTAYPAAYQAFIDRNRDKSPQVRAAWATAAGRILLTSAGGKGLDIDQQTALLRLFADLIVDHDEKVRLATVKVIAQFDFPSVLQKLAAHGSVNKEGSILHNLCSRVRDPKHAVSAAAIELAARIWGVASGAIVEGNDRIREIFGSIPSKIFDAMYANHRPLYALIQKVMYDSLLPIGFPHIKSKPSRQLESQRVPDSQHFADGTPDPDRIRVERILVLVRDLNERSRTAFFALQQQQISRARYLRKILELSETLANKKAKDGQAKQHRQKLIEAVAASWPDAPILEHHLSTFFDCTDPRNYKLVDFSINPGSKYKTSKNGIAELVAKISKSTNNLASCAEAVQTVLRSSAPLVYNKSHVPAIVAISRADEEGLVEAAHEVLKQISGKAPEIFELHVGGLCKTLKEQAPSATTKSEESVVDSLKACAGFARQFPQKIPNDRDFYQALANYAKFGSPAVVAKHAITVLVASADKKEMYVKDILKHSLKGFDISAESTLTKLAALSQLRLLAYRQTEDHADAIQQLLTDALHNGTAAKPTDPDWTDDVSQELNVQLWALKALINGVRAQAAELGSTDASDELEDPALRGFKLLNTVVDRDGELMGVPTPAHHKSRLRLAAAKSILKLCNNKALDQYFAPRDFNRLTRIVQDTRERVRAGFNGSLKKYLSQGKISLRFFSLMFIHAFEPTRSLKTSTETFIKARAASFAKAPETESAMVQVFAYFLSLLAHHQDFSPAVEDIPDFIDYILFYLKTVATEHNLSAIYAIALRAKTCEDLVDPSNSKNLWVMADLAEGVIRAYEQIKGWALQASATKPKMPGRLFRSLGDADRADEVSRKRFLPVEVDEHLDDLVKDRLKKKSKKRKAADDDGDGGSPKKARTSIVTDKSIPVRKKAAKVPKVPKSTKTQKKSARDAVPSSERRKSGRASNAKSYVEDDESDEEEFERWQAAEDSSDDDETNKENMSSASTPPTSDPAPKKAEKLVSETTSDANAGRRATRTKGDSAAARKTRAVPQKRAAAAKNNGRATRGTKAKEKDVMDVPSDSEEEKGDESEELSDAPEDMEE